MPRYPRQGPFGDGSNYQLSTYPRMLGHAISMGVLMITAYYVKFVDWIVRDCLVELIRKIFDADWEFEELKPIHQQRVIVEPILEENEVINETATLAQRKMYGKTENKNQEFLFAPEELIEKTKTLIAAEFGSKNEDLLSWDFQFIFPVVGPLRKDEFVKTFSDFKLKDAFPDSKGNYFGFTVDPVEPNRVWFFSRATMTHTGDLTFGKKVFPATGKHVINTPQVLSMSFNTEGECYKFTGGYSIDRTAGNCGGLGGLFGIIYSIGGSLPFPEARPWRPSLQWEALYRHVTEVRRKWADMW